jgi:hypothetical protein
VASVEDGASDVNDDASTAPTAAPAEDDSQGGVVEKLIWLFCLPLNLLIWPILKGGELIGTGLVWLLSCAWWLWRRKLRKPCRTVASILWWPIGRLTREMPWCFALAILCLVQLNLSFYLATWGEEWLTESAELTTDFIALLTKAGFATRFHYLTLWAYGLSALSVLCFVLSFVPIRGSRWILKLSAWAFLGLWLYLLYFLVEVPSYIYMNRAEVWGVGARNVLWVKGVWLWVPGMLFALYQLLSLGRRGVIDSFTSL